MAKAPQDDIDESGLRVTERKEWAAGVPGVTHALSTSLAQMGPVRTARTLSRLNQKHGFDCPGCAWPDPEHRSVAEYCENGAKAVAEEATTRTVSADFFAAHDVDDLAGRTDWWLGQQGRLVGPLVKPAGSRHYEPIGWDAALDLVADELRALDDPDEAVFYTSGRTSNEAAFAYQLLVRGYGTNNLPDCSNMCHESSGSALTETLGVGKGSVTLEDLHRAELIIIAGQNPGTNHPRMLSALEVAKKNGARVVAVNPLPEAGLLRFKNPQHPDGVLGRGTELADAYLPVRLGGDLALFQALGNLLVTADDDDPGSVVDRAFVDRFTTGYEPYAAHVRTLNWDEVDAATGLDRAQIRDLADRLKASRRTIVCWAMGITQHKAALATIREMVNVLLLQGNLGRKGAGVCPVRGHSNVQGDRTMGIFERMPDWFLDRLGALFSFEPPREHGFDTVASIGAFRDGKAKVFVAMGGNFIRATPDSDVTEKALRRARLTVQVSTKLNRSHAVTGEIAVILPCLGRTERDTQVSGDQVVTVEDSMGAVHASRGHLAPASAHLRSETAIVCGLAQRLLGEGGARRPGAPDVPWSAWQADYASIRSAIATVVPGFEDFETKVARPGGFHLPHAVRDGREFATQTGRANFSANDLEYPRVPAGRLLLQTIRSHDQYNTTIYGLDDRYRGIHGGRRVVLVNPDDVSSLGLRDGQHVDLVGEWHDGVERRAESFRLVQYPTARGCAAAYFPETNVLVPLDHVADVSNTPVSKAVVIRLEPSAR